MVRTRKSEPTWVVYMLGGKRAQRLGTVAAPDHEAAIAKAIEFFGITEPRAAKAPHRAAGVTVLSGRVGFNLIEASRNRTRCTP